MTEEDFELYLTQAVKELEVKQEHLHDLYGFGRSERFVVDYVTGLYTIFIKEKPLAEARITPVATHIPSKDSLKWGWSKDDYPEAVRAEASQVKKLYDLTGFEMFREEMVECDQVMAWEIAALACKYLGTMGALRITHKELHSFVLVKEVKKFP